MTNLAVVVLFLSPVMAQQPADAEVAALIKVLEDPGKDDKAKEDACKKLEKQGKKAVAAAPALLGLSGREALRFPAAKALGALGPDAVPALVVALKHRDSQRRRMALVALVIRSRTENAALPGLIEVFGDEDDELAMVARRALVGAGAKAVPALTAGLEHRDVLIRLRSATALGWMVNQHVFPGTRPALPALLKALKDPAPGVRAPAAMALSSVGKSQRDPYSPARATVAALETALADQHVEVREQAALGLGVIGPPAASAVPALIKALGDSNERVRTASAQALTRMGGHAYQALPALREALKKAPENTEIALALWSVGRDQKLVLPVLLARMGVEQDAQRRYDLVRALREIGSAAVPELLAKMSSPEERTRSSAFFALGDLGPEAVTAVPALVKALQDNSSAIRSMAARSLRSIGPAARAAVPALIRGLKDDVNGVRDVCCEALKAIGPGAREAIPALRAALKDTDALVRGAALSALLRFGEKDEELLGLLRVGLKDAQVQTRLTAAENLVRLGKPDEALPVLLKLLGEKDDRVGVLKALQQIGAPARAAVQPVLALLPGDPILFYAAIDTLAAIGSDSIPELARALAGKELERRAAAGYALGRMGPAAAPAVPELVKLLADPDDDMRYQAIDALGGIGPQARAAVPGLLKLLKDNDPDLRRHAASALGHVARPEADVVQGLGTLLADPEDYVREEAAAALAWLGPEAKAALPALEEAAKTTRGLARVAVALAIARLDPSHAGGILVLIAALKDANWEVRSQVTRNLVFLGPSARDAVAAALVLQLKSPIIDLRFETARTLGHLGPDRTVVLALGRALADPSPRIATEAAWSLTRARGEDLKAVLPPLVKLVDDPDPERGTAGSLAVLICDGQHKQARSRLKEQLDVLTRQLEESRRFPQNPTARPRALHWLAALELLGADAKPALPLVKRLAKADPDENIRQAATRTLKAIEG